MEAPAQLLAAVPALATALALLLAWLLLRRGAASKREPGKPEKAVAAAPAEEQDTQARKEAASAPAPIVSKEDGPGCFSFHYSPGKLRGNQYRKMLAREELEEEQRVQKEQLAAIFKLLKDNKDTFGEMSDYDVQEQLRLYDM
ncbi:matrix-remodeling-associated protein 7 [Suncus etruscus]|uniref:matrix-remodeling-associated protein 7 n=1 Tax=Suncus etruscus TaxID=109475 RepID=UPI002110620F|nr:matrix-remodeling-associated protein 7 [Suncus etruscus]